MRFLALLALCFAAVAAVPSNPQRIVGGSVTTIEQYPSIVALLYSSDLSTYRQACGGTILNNRSILTAAQCFIGDTADRWRIRLGSTWANSGGIVHNVNTITIHPSYDAAFTTDYDVAIIRSASTILFNNTIRAATIAGSNYNLGDNQVVWAAGWGRTSDGGPPSEQLRHVQIWTVNQAICRTSYGASTITDNLLCAGWFDVGGRSQCQGDTGGPLYHNGIVVGVYSFGRFCGMPAFPGVNGRVSSYSAWIQSNA